MDSIDAQEDLRARFADAQVRVRKLAKSPGPQDLLTLYALYKQASVGDITGSRPGMLEIKGRAKFDAWTAERGVSQEAAMQKYIELVDRLVK